MTLTRSIVNPRDVPEAHAIIRRLCALQAHVVSELLGYDDPADCFCGDEGFWPLSSAADYRNAGKAVEFIETATLQAIEAHKTQGGGKAALEEYGWHKIDPVCDAIKVPPAGPCTCGFEKALHEMMKAESHSTQEAGS